MTKHISPEGILIAREVLMSALENGENLSDDAVSNALYSAMAHVYDTDDVKQIVTRSDLRTFHQSVKLRDDWHEPSERDITATVVGEKFDNSDTDVENVYHHFGDMAVVLWRTEEEDEGAGAEQLKTPLAVVNLCDLLSWATEDESRERKSSRVLVNVYDEEEIFENNADFVDDDDDD